MSEGLPSSLDPPRLAHKAQRFKKQIRPSATARGRFAGWVWSARHPPDDAGPAVIGDNVAIELDGRLRLGAGIMAVGRHHGFVAQEFARDFVKTRPRIELSTAE
jgi:hypothetical protein